MAGGGMTIRQEIPPDQDAIHRVNALAFGREGEAKLVDALRANGKLVLSLVAEAEGHVAAHVAFSPAVIELPQAKLDVLALGPVAVLPEARANPNQLLINEHTRDGLAALLHELLETHRHEFGSTDDLLVGFQLTHSGRFAKPFRKDRPEPQILYHHPILDRKFHLPADYP
ncbi:MAG: N-acetyltransferase [Anaerolineae bacterium]|nr:N-acetyltransferase [Anaerolineae bacterium]